MRQIDKPISVEITFEGLVTMVQAVRQWGQQPAVRQDCTPRSHVANQMLLQLRSQLQEKHPGLWEEISATDTIVWMFEPNVKPDRMHHEPHYEPFKRRRQ